MENLRLPNISRPKWHLSKFKVGIRFQFHPTTTQEAVLSAYVPPARPTDSGGGGGGRRLSSLFLSLFPDTKIGLVYFPAT
jgi:hypothetical protein